MSDIKIDVVDYVENVMGIHLLDYQKIMIRKMATYDQLYITLPPTSIGKVDFRTLIALLDCILGEEKGERK